MTLYEVYDSLKDQMKTRLNRLDACRRDSKKLEKILHTNAISPTRVWIYSGDQFCKHGLQWEIHIGSGDYRLLYHCFEKNQLSDPKPIIECKAAVRLEAYPFLGDFLTFAVTGKDPQTQLVKDQV